MRTRKINILRAYEVIVLGLCRQQAGKYACNPEMHEFLVLTDLIKDFCIRHDVPNYKPVVNAADEIFWRMVDHIRKGGAR